MVVGLSYSIDPIDGEITLIPLFDVAFLRGDGNDDGHVNIADAIFLLNFLFQGADPPLCRASGDINGDGELDTSDVIFLLNYRFLAGPNPPLPFPICGVNSEESCELFENCP